MASFKKVNFTLLASEWGSKHGGLSTFNRVFAIELAKHPEANVSIFVTRCNQEEIEEALSNNITLVQASRKAAFDEKDWLCFPPEDLQIDIVIGHGVVLGRPAQIIRESRRCKWIQFVHTDPEELGMFKGYSEPIAKGEQKHKKEVELCIMADSVVAVGPKLGEAYRSYLRKKKDQKVFVLTPGIFNEFSSVEQATQDGDRCRVLAFGRGDAEDFELKGFDIAAKAVGKLENANLIFVGAATKRQDEVAVNLKQCDIPPSRLRVRTFLESREELKDLFCEVDLAIMPSRTEGFGLAALEALSAGLPILVGGNSGFGGALSKVAFGSGCVIHSEDPVEWANAIQRVWGKHRETRLEESDALRTSYAKKFSWEKQCNDLVEIAKSIVTDESAPNSKRKASSSGTQDPGAGESASKSRRLSDKSNTQKPDQTTPEIVESEGEPVMKQRTSELTRNSSTQDTRGARAVKSGTPTNDELEELSGKLGDDWIPLVRKLFSEDESNAKIHKFDTENRRLEEKAYQMLLHWKQSNGVDATYQVLYEALSKNRKDLAIKFCT
ncbi:D-inositol 3-phosphate glycosyltransferase-like [Oculina patagonica]